jgi:hypothetical protein
MQQLKLANVSLDSAAVRMSTTVIAGVVETTYSYQLQCHCAVLRSLHACKSLHQLHDCAHIANNEVQNGNDRIQSA